jgi:hypothetical protein
MEAFNINITDNNTDVQYRIIDKQTDKCEFEVYFEEHLMAVFESDENEYIHICRNPGGLDEEVIVQIADRIEAHYL